MHMLRLLHHAGHGRMEGVAHVRAAYLQGDTVYLSMRAANDLFIPDFPFCQYVTRISWWHVCRPSNANDAGIVSCGLF